MRARRRLVRPAAGRPDRRRASKLGVRGALVLSALISLAGCGSQTPAAGSLASVPVTVTPTPSVATSAPRTPGWAPTTPDPTQWAVEQPVSGLSPVSVEIPAIDVRSDLLDLAVDDTGVLVPPEPYDIAGWFTGGPVPGDLGPAVIAGHVDSRAGPGVFFRLEEMEVGQKIAVTRSDGSVATFTVRRVGSWPKTAFPTDLVYGPTPDRELRLITCGGDFDRSRRSYIDNIVVFAVLDR